MLREEVDRRTLLAYSAGWLRCVLVVALLEEDEVATEGVRRVCEKFCCCIGGETRTGGAADDEVSG